MDTRKGASDLPTIDTPRLRLRPFALTDASELQRLAGAREVAAMTMNIPHPYPDGAAEDWIVVQAEKWQRSELLALAIEVLETTTFVGTVLLKLAPAHRRAELGYWIGVPFWGRGFATEAATAMVEYGFTVLGLDRIEAHYLACNDASGRVLEKVGMQREGVLRQHIVKWDQAHDSIACGMLASEYQSNDTTTGEQD